MHKSSLEHVSRLVDSYLSNAQAINVLDIGSYDVNGSYKQFFSKPGWKYTGVDLAAGPNVDVVLTSPYRFPIKSYSIDVIVSGQAFEHIEYFWLSWLEMARMVRPGGLIFLLAPSRGYEHRHPQDCWRFYPDSYKALANYANMELLEVKTDWTPHPDPDSAPWGDTVGVFRQRPLSRLTKIRRQLAQSLRYRLMPGYSS
jgi:SAM-dependent methyltransferase